MLDSRGYPQLMDFTLSKRLTECGGRTYTLVGIPEYNSPEQVQKSGHNTSPDWWALGILCFELLLGTTPFAAEEGPPTEKVVEEKAAQKETASPAATASNGAGARRTSVARLLVTTGGGELENTLRTYQGILAYASSPEPKLEYPKTAKDLSENAKSFIEDLLEPNPKQRLGCRGGGFEQFEVHKWLHGLDFTSLEDGSLESPFQKVCQDEAIKLFKQSTATPVGFEAPSYVGDGKWCDDWDDTCTMGATVGTSFTEKPKTFAGRRESTFGLDSVDSLNATEKPATEAQPSEPPTSKPANGAPPSEPLTSKPANGAPPSEPKPSQPANGAPPSESLTSKPANGATPSEPPTAQPVAEAPSSEPPNST